MENKRRLGKRYEDLAAKYLESIGYIIVKRNYFATGCGEIDIIARDKEGLLVFCECKYRKNYRFGGPESAVDYRKRKKISMCALHYYMEQGYEMDYPCRFDILAIDAKNHVKHIENAFEFAYVY